MTRFLILLSLMALQQCSAEVPKLFLQEQFSAADLAEAVNHFVGIGEAATIDELNTLASSTNDDRRRIIYRVGWVCRILFEATNAEPLLPPPFGGLEDLGNFGLDTSPILIVKTWPLYPVALSGSTYFVLGDQYAGGGFAAPPKEYITYCQRSGLFRKDRVKVPTREQAIKDASALRRLEAWTSIKWKDLKKGESYGSEEYSWAFIQNQANSIPRL